MTSLAELARKVASHPPRELVRRGFARLRDEFRGALDRARLARGSLDMKGEEVLRGWDPTRTPWREVLRTDHERGARSVLSSLEARPGEGWLLCPPSPDRLREELPRGVAAVLERARAASRHTFDILGTGPVDLGDPIEWWSDFQGRRWPGGYYRDLNRALLTGRFDGPEYIGDIKLPWELNKHLHLVDLARAAYLTEDRSYAEEAMAQWRHWLDTNAFKMGPAWMQPLIVAQRAISWCLALPLLIRAGVVTEEDAVRVAGSLVQHGRFILENLEVADRASNHLIGNLAGLFVIAWTLPEWEETGSWLQFSLEGLAEEAMAQVYPDGVQYEQSTAYHRYCAQFFVIVAVALERRGEAAWPIAVNRRIESMFVYLMHALQPDGRFPSLSDADGALVWRNDDAPIDDPRSLLGLGAALWGRRDLCHAAEGCPDDVAWFLGEEGLERFRQMRPKVPSEDSSVFPQGGYAFLRDGWSSTATWTYLDFGEIGMGRWPDGAEVGTHGHSDLLSFGLHAQGEPLLVDPGTFTYTGSKPYHDYFRGGTGHNILTVDGLDPCELTRTWCMRHHARPVEPGYRFTGAVDGVWAGHDGYRRLKCPLRVDRGLLFLKAERLLVLRDAVRASGGSEGDAAESDAPRRIKLSFHCHPDVTVERDGPGATLLLRGRRARVQLQICAGDEPSFVMHRGEEPPEGGWYAPDYGVKVPATVVRAHITARLPWRGYTLIDVSGERRQWLDADGLDRLFDEFIRGGRPL